MSQSGYNLWLETYLPYSLLGMSTVIQRGKMKIFSIGFFVCLLMPQLFLAAAENTLDRPNIVWIVGENLKLDLGCYGAQHVKTPHLDGLAKEGMRYTKVFSTSPVCAPSRSAFFTGMYQTSSDTHN
ncbi:MAG: sulfatase-like hydrolase/transferase, partial [Pirellulales bacterium]|nr:sulfatase-like hydrolase/transferase [Pirellulales bacterium]